ncbi:MAG: ABC transporter ATP-binding protein [Bacteroidota bacterium]
MSLIRIEHLTKIYNGGKEQVHAVNAISLEVDQGEFAAVIGPSGSGKSTLLSILGGLNHPTEGKVIVDEIDVYTLRTEQLADFRREYIGFVFQSFQLIPYLTVLENVMLPLSVTSYSDAVQTEMALRMLDQVALTGKARRLTDELSGGEQERVAIARALVNEPPIILADEPTGNLDSMTAEGVMQLLQGLKGAGKTIVMVTHNPENVKFADRCIKLRDGAVVE